jgi:hypothetical protein
MYDHPSQEKQMGRICSMYWERRSACRALMGKPEGKETTWKTQE